MGEKILVCCGGRASGKLAARLIAIAAANIIVLDESEAIENVGIGFVVTPPPRLEPLKVINAPTTGPRFKCGKNKYKKQWR